jgi:hypothetical protein
MQAPGAPPGLWKRQGLVDPKLVTPILFAALLVWGIYRRMRRTFGRQSVNAGRMWFRVGVLTFVGALVLLGTAHNMSALEGMLGGIVCGCALGYLGLKHTQFEITSEGSFYIPHTYIGLVVTALFLGRLVYRLFAVYATGQAGMSAGMPAGTPPGDPMAAVLASSYQNPLTVAVFGVLIGYYLLFNLGVLQKTRTLAPQTP